MGVQFLHCICKRTSEKLVKLSLGRNTCCVLFSHYMTAYSENHVFVGYIISMANQLQILVNDIINFSSVHITGVPIAESTERKWIKIGINFI